MDWMEFTGEEGLPSPMLVLHWERIESNLQRMLARTGDANRLRPHLKTHKLPQIMRRQVALGIRKCKAATIAEAQMAADAGTPDILLSVQPVGPNPERLARLIHEYPNSHFSTLCDHPRALQVLSQTAVRHGIELEVLLDINVGQNRTGIAPGAAAEELYATLCAMPGIRCGGLHTYEGHLHQADPVERKQACDAAYEPVWKLRDSLRARRLSVPKIVAGGSPTFPFHAENPEVECSPGTSVLWDAGYGTRFPDMTDLLPAAVLLTRVISVPAPGTVCLDLGHKAVASEMQHPRVVFPRLPDAKVLAHNEEHLVLQSSHATELAPGDRLHGIPWHICPTVALQSEVAFVREGMVEKIVPVAARARRLTI
jgi:D-serine deaminase-like pyridoxal phosphate-dependent protein